MKCSDYLDSIVSGFLRLEADAPLHKRHGSVCQNEVNISESDYLKVLIDLGLEYGRAYHSSGIGNNNEYKIVKVDIDDDGFRAEKIIGTFTYNYSMYGNKAYVYFEDNKNNMIYRHHDDIFSEDCWY